MLAHGLTASETYSDTWDVANGQYRPAPTDAKPLPYTPIAPAQSYTWNAADQLIPQCPLGTSAATPAAPSAIGDPEGGTAFSMWQPASLLPITEQFLPTGSPDYPGTYAFTPHRGPVAWSPDGHILLDGMGTSPLVEAPSQRPLTAAQWKTMGGGIRPFILPVRDAWLGTVLNSYVTNTDVSLSAAWRPDGKLLAVQTVLRPLALSSVGPSNDVVTIYEGATGKAVATLNPPPGYTNYGILTSQLAWSPDGSRLLLFDGFTSEFTIWGAGALPRG